MKKLGTTMSMLAACLLFTVFSTVGCDADAKFRPDDQNTPQVPGGDTRGDGRLPTEGGDEDADLENLK